MSNDDRNDEDLDGTEFDDLRAELAPASFPVLDTPQWRARVAAMSEHQLELLRAGELFFAHATSYGAQRVQLTPPAWLFDDDTPPAA